MQLLPSPKAAVAEPISKHCCLVSGVLLCNCWPSPKAAVAEPISKHCCLVSGVLLCNCCQVQRLL